MLWKSIKPDLALKLSISKIHHYRELKLVYLALLNFSQYFAKYFCLVLLDLYIGLLEMFI
jgi:hypothetical protein